MAKATDPLQEAVFGTLNTAESDRPWTLTEWAIQERSHLWDELDQARREALNGSWSMRCENIVGRLVGVTRFVGPEPWESVQIGFLRLACGSGSTS